MNIIPEQEYTLQEALEALIKQELEDFKPLTAEEREAIGVGSKRVLLGWDSRYRVYRQGRDAYIEDIKAAKTVRFRLEDHNNGKGPYTRDRIIVSQLKGRLPGLYRWLTPTGLWKSLNGKTPKVYLYRLVFALHYRKDIFWAGTNTQHVEDTSPALLGVNHINGISCDDRHFNLELLSYEAHAIVEKERSGKEEEQAIEALFSLNEADYAGDELLEPEYSITLLPQVHHYWVVADEAA